MSISRADKGGFADWWFTVDKVALGAMAGLIAIGLMLGFAASPAITGGPLTAGDFHYAVRQLAYALVALCILALGLYGDLVLLSDDAALDEVESWINTNSIPRTNTVAIAALNQRIKDRFGVVRQAHAAPVLARWQAFKGFGGLSEPGSPGRKPA